jgi:hypothetical protein
LTLEVKRKPEPNKLYDSEKYPALKHRTKTKLDLDTNTVETEYFHIWKDRQITKEAPKFLSPKEIKSISDKHKPCESVCCSAKQDLEELGILEQYKEHMKQVRENLK